MDTLFLVQIPETAGSNLRLAACRLWGSAKIITDYGPTNRHTSESVLDLIHQEKDFHGFKTWLQDNDIALFTSQAPLRRLRRIFPASDIITFLRDPVDLIIHRYQSAVITGYKGSLQQFAALRVHRDIQTRFLRSVPLELLGFVGLTERFSDSLTLLNEQYDFNLSQLTAQNNVCANGRSDLDDIKKKDRDDIASLNQQDMQLYCLKLVWHLAEKKHLMCTVEFISSIIRRLKVGQFPINPVNPVKFDCISIRSVSQFYRPVNTHPHSKNATFHGTDMWVFHTSSNSN